MVAFSMRIGNTSFELEISPCSISHQNSEVAVEYVPSIDEFENEPDALLKLRNFHGTMRISRIHSLGLDDTRDFEYCKSVAENQTYTEKCFPSSISNADETNQRFSSIATKTFNDEDDQNEYKLENRSSALISSNSKLTFHTLCNKENASVGKLKAMLLSQPLLARQCDDLGRLPLHVICRNKSLICGRKRQEIKTFVKHLYNVYPEALNMADSKGYIPFSETIEEWINNNCHDSCRIRGEDNFLPQKVILTPITKWSFEMLSVLIEDAPSEYLDINEFVVDKIASIKSLVKTVLEISDPNLIPDLLHCTVFRKILQRKEALGPWIVKMLMNSCDEASRIIDYFEILSSSTILCNELVEENIIKNMTNIKELIPSLNNLSNSEQLRASNTRIIQKLLTSYFVEPIAIAIMFMDTTFHILLVLYYIAYFWSIVRAFGQSNADNTINVDHSMSDVTSFALIWLCVYFLLRDDLTNILVARSFKNLIKIYRRPSNIVKVSAIILALASPIYTYFRKTKLLGLLHPVTIALLWLRLLLFMKGINIKLSAFIVTVNKIIESMAWFLIIFLIGCYSFGGVMTMTILTTNPSYCDEVSTVDTSIQADFCSLNPNSGAIRAYSMMAGDISLDDYKMNDATTFIWILYTLYGVIVLLNVLIAVVNDSYQQTYSNRLALANKERIPVLTKHLRLISVANNIFGAESRSRCFWKTLCFCLVIAFFSIWHFLLLRIIKYYVQNLLFVAGKENEVRFLFYLTLQIFCTLVADIALFFIGFKILDLKICCCKDSRLKTFVTKQLKNVVSVFLGIYDQSEFYEEEDRFITMREAIDKLEGRINSKLDEIHDQILMLFFHR